MMRWRLLILAGSFALVSAAPCAALADDETFAGKCHGGAADGAWVAKKEYCDYFKFFRSNSGGYLDTRIKDFLGIKDAGDTRAIALVISVSHYPGMPGNELPAAAVDGKRLVDFLINKQQFDEVIHLQDEKANIDTIQYFMQTYLPRRSGQFKGKARVLIAYSGHGRNGGTPSNPALEPALVLSAADNMEATSGVYEMDRFFKQVKLLAGTNAPESRAKSPFHLVTLVNACYGGHFFGTALSGGAENNFKAPGSWGITAGNDKMEVPSLIEGRGSLFFDLLIEGVTSGKVDEQYFNIYKIDKTGSRIESHGLTRLGPLASYLNGNYDVISSIQSRPGKPLELSAPWAGPVEDDYAQGGFFFLTDRPASAPPDVADIYVPGSKATTYFGESQSTSTPLNLPAGPISALPGHPNVLVFKAPEVYPIRGFDVSAAEGAIDWSAFGAATHPRFIFAQALGWRGADPAYQERREGAQKVGADFGAYGKFDFCKSPNEQLELFRQTVRREDLALPVALELIDPRGLDQKQKLIQGQTQCLEKVGVPAAQQAILQLANSLRESYGKTPLLFGNRSDLSTLIDNRSNEYMSWVAHYDVHDVEKTGLSPWTLWQYSGKLDIAGIGPNTTGDAFFGTEKQYLKFKAGEGNVALIAATNVDHPE